MPSWLWNLLEKVFHYLDRQLHTTTYLELDERVISLSNQLDEALEEKENLEDAFENVRHRNRVRYADYE